MSSFENETSPKEKGTIKYFERGRAIAIWVSGFAIAFFLFITYLTVPLFFGNFWLCLALLFVIFSAKSYGSWDAYTKMRKQTEQLQHDLDAISQAVKKETTNV